MKKYFVTQCDFDYAILKEAVDPIAGHYYADVMDGVESEKEAERVCAILNQCYTDGKEDLSKGVFLVPNEQLDIFKASISFLQVKKNENNSEMVQRFLKQIENNELKLYSLNYQYNKTSPNLTFVTFACGYDDAVSLLRSHCKNNNLIITSISLM